MITHKDNLKRWDRLMGIGSKEVFEQNTVYQGIRARFESQIDKGLEKYGEAVLPETLDLEEWIEHTAEELTDILVYLECAKQRLKKHTNN